MFKFARTTYYDSMEFHVEGAFFLEGAISHIKTSSTQILGGIVFEAHLELLKIALIFFSTDVPNLHILPSGDIPVMSFNSIMRFRNLASKMVH